MTAIAQEPTVRPSCLATRASLRSYVRAGLPNRTAHRVSAHLECCRACTHAYLELVERPPRVRNTARVSLRRRV